MPPRKIITFLRFVAFLSCIGSGVDGQTLTFFVGHEADTVLILDTHGKLAARLVWRADTTVADTATMIASVLASPITPPQSVGANYLLGPTISLQPKYQAPPYTLYWRLTIRVYVDTSLFMLNDLQYIPYNYDISVFRHDPPASFTRLTLGTVDPVNNFVEFETDSASSGFVVSAMNILIGQVNPGDFPDSTYSNLYVPKRKVATLASGVHFYDVNGLSNIVVMGTLQCNGSSSNPIILTTGITAYGPTGTNPKHLPPQIACTWVQGFHLNVDASSVSMDHSNIRWAYLQDSSSIQMSNSQVGQMDSQNSYIMADSCHFLTPGPFSVRNCVLTIANSSFDSLAYETDQTNSILHLTNNVIMTRASLSLFHSVNSLMILERNKIIYYPIPNYDNGNCVGIQVFSGTTAIITGNIVVGYRNAVEVDYDANAVIYNNTFVKNTGGVALCATTDSVSIENNIEDQLVYQPAIDLMVSTNYWRDNRVWISNNLWNTQNNSKYIYPDSAGAGVVVEDGPSINASPQFVDNIDYDLQQTSPAIDAGAKVIKSFAASFHVLDTTVTVPDSIVPTGYYGAAPDIGAKEFGAPVSVREQPGSNVSHVFRLDQNYPNPFNPETEITYELPVSEFVTLKVFDILGREAETLVNEKETAGGHSVIFNAGSFSSGVYFYRITAGAYNKTMKLVIVK